MPLDPVIAGGVRPVELPDPLQQYARISAIQNAQNQNALAQYQLSQAQRQDQEANALRQSLPADFDPGNPAHVAAVLRASPIQGAGLLEKVAKVQQDQMAAQKTKSEALGTTMTQARDVLANYVDTPEKFAMWSSGIHNHPLLGPFLKQLGSSYEGTLQELSQVKTPEEFAALKNRALLTANELMKRGEPVKLGAGETLYNPQTNKPIYQAPQNDPAAVQEYKLAVQQGYKGTINQFLNERAAAGAAKTSVSVASYLPASEEAQRDFMKATGENYRVLRNVPAILQNIEQAKLEIPKAKMFMGPGGEPLLQAAKFLNNRFGTSIATEGVKRAEELRSRLFMGVMDNLRKMDAQPTERQQIMLQEAFGRLGTDPNALPSVMDVVGGIMREKVSLHNQEIKSAESRGVKFPYDATIKLPEPAQPAQARSTEDQQALDWANSNPKDPRAAKIKQRLGVQ